MNFIYTLMFRIFQYSKIKYNEIPINANPAAKNISFFVSDVVALYNKTPPARPTNKTEIPIITISKLSVCN